MNQKKITSIVFIVQNNSFPFDHRVFKQARSASAAGYDVHVISPQSALDPQPEETIDGVRVYRYPNALSSGSFSGYIKEYAVSIYYIYRMFRTLCGRFDVAAVHVANPPDLFWPLALYCKMYGIRFIYDQHDLVPEMYALRFGKGFVYWILLLNEYLTALLADHIITVNSTFVRRSRKKWGLPEEKYTVVMNGPSKGPVRTPPQHLLERYRGSKVIVYVGLMSVNDHIDVVLELASDILLKHGRTECRCILIGSGDVEPRMRQLSRDMNIDDVVEFTGALPHAAVMEYLALADLCLVPDRPNGMNEYLTHVKTLEYMMASKPFVGFHLKETMDRSMGSALFASDRDDFASKVLFLLDHPDEARRLGEHGRAAVMNGLLWEHSEQHLLSAYQKILL